MTAISGAQAVGSSGPDPDAHLPAMFRIPGSLWFYATFRALSFAAPLFTATGRLGLGLIVVIMLWAAVVQRRASAWIALAVVDVASIALLWAGLFVGSGARPLAPVLASLALLCLLLPSTRHHVDR